jgi:hypothetical protein
MFMKRTFPICRLTILTVWVLISFLPNRGFPKGPSESTCNSESVFCFFRDIVVNSHREEVKVELRGEGLTTDFHSFTLARPPRLVIDFPGVLNSFPKKLMNVNHPLLKNVRLGQHPDKLRVVLTFAAMELPPHQIIQEGGGLTILVGNIVKVSERGKKPEAKEKKGIDEPRMPDEKILQERLPPLATVSPARASEERKSTLPPEGPEAETTSVNNYSGKKVTLDFINADIRRVFALISEAAQRQIVPSAAVQGTITLRFIDVPWDQALEVILSIYKLKRVDEGRLIRILPGEKS